MSVNDSVGKFTWSQVQGLVSQAGGHWEFTGFLFWSEPQRKYKFTSLNLYVWLLYVHNGQFETRLESFMDSEVVILWSGHLKDCVLSSCHSGDFGGR